MCTSFTQISVNGLDGAGSTPLHWAAHGGHLKCLETLLAQPKCEINVQVIIFVICTGNLACDDMCILFVLVL